MIEMVTEFKKDLASTEYNRFKIRELYKNHPHVFRKGYDQDHKFFLVTRSFDDYFPNIIITQDICLAIKAKSGIDYTFKPLNINKDHMDENLFNFLPNFFSRPDKISPDLSISIQKYKKENKIISFAIIDYFQLQEKNSEKFINNLIYLSQLEASKPLEQF